MHPEARTKIENDAPSVRGKVQRLDSAVPA